MKNNISFSKWPNYSAEESNIVKKIIQTNKVNYWTGKYCKLFEIEFSKYVGTKYAISVMNGSVALETSLKAIGISKGDEVIVTSKSFVISASSVLNIGAKPVFSDIIYDNHNIDPFFVKKLITKKTKAIIAVHLAGWSCDMIKLKKIANFYSLKLIEDCSQAHGAKLNNRPVGSFGDVSVWSFCNDKIMTTGGEGGMIATNNKKYYLNANSYKDHGKNFTKIKKNKKKIGFQFVHDGMGTNYRMTEMQAGIGLYQLKKLDKWINKRFSILKYFWSKAKKIKGIYIPPLPKNIIHSAYRIYIFIDKKKLKKNINVKEIIKKINYYGIPCSTGACSEIYRETVFKKYFKKPFKRLKNAKLSTDTSIIFFVNPFTKRKEIDFTIKVLKKVFNKISK